MDPITKMPYRIRTRQGDFEVRTYPAYKWYITKLINVMENRTVDTKTSELFMQAVDQHTEFCKKHLIPLLKKEEKK